MDKPKILIFHHSGAIGGGGVSMLHILEAINRSRYDVAVYCPDEPGDMMHAIETLGFSVRGRFDKGWVYPHFNGRSYTLIDPRFVKASQYIRSAKQKINTILRRERPDLLILNSVTLFWMGAIAKSQGIKTICFDRETLPYELLGIRNRRIIRALSRDFDAVAFLSEFDADVCKSPQDKRYIIHDRVDLSLFESVLDKEQARKALGFKKDQSYILYMGGTWPIKGPRVILSAMQEIDAQLLFLQYQPPQRSRIKLSQRKGIKGKLRYLLGLDYEARIVNMIDKHKLWDRIHFAPAQRDIRAWFAACDVVVFPSTKPHQARPIYESGAACRPVVVSDFGNTREFAKHGVNALTFKPRNGKHLAQQLRKLLDDKDLTDRLVRENHEKTKADHDLSTLPNDISALIDNTLKGESKA